MTKKHEREVNWISTHPYVICERPIISAKNVLFFNKAGNTETEVDNLVYNGALYLVEYKTNINEEEKAIKQLYRQERFVRGLGYNGLVHKVFLHGDIK